MFWVWEHWAACLGVGVPVRPVLIAILFRVFPLGWKGQVDSITLAKSFVRGGRDGRLRSAAATKSSPLRFCPFGLEDSALSFLWFGVADRSSRRPPPPPGWHIGRPCRRGLLPFPVLIAPAS